MILPYIETFRLRYLYQAMEIFIFYNAKILNSLSQNRLLLVDKNLVDGCKISLSLEVSEKS